MPAQHLTLSGIQMEHDYDEVVKGEEFEIKDQAHYSFTEMDSPCFFKWIESAAYLGYSIACRIYKGRYQTMMIDIISYRKKL